MDPDPSRCQCVPEDEGALRERVIEVIDGFKGEEGSLIRILHLVQGIYGYLPLDIQRLVAERLDIPLSEVTGVSSFYSFFTTRPRGKYTICVCMGTACYVRGGNRILKRLTETLGIGVGETTPDRKYSLEVMRCMGACGLAPAVSVNGEIIPQVNPDKLNKILDKCE